MTARERHGRPESENEREATERARYFVREHDLRKPVALAAAWRQMGYSPSGIAKRIETGESTVKKYVEAIEDEFGLQAVMPKIERNRTGPLGDGASETGVGPDEHERDIEARDAPDLSDDARTLPEAFLKRNQWLIRDEKVPKAPWTAGSGLDRGGGGDDPGNRQMWADFETADNYLDMLPTPKWGLYFVLRPSDPFAALDLDDCRDPETGVLDERAREIVERVDSFTEASPSGTGLHIYVRGSVPRDLVNDTEGVELYDDRQMTVTGNHLDGTTTDIRERQDVLDELADEHMTESASEVAVERDGEYENENEDVEPWSPFDALAVTDVYPDHPTGTNVPHPEHGSNSGQNFRIAGDGETATCWHAQHRVGDGDGCGLNAHHLLAMRATGTNECDTIRKRWPDDDELVFETWRHTVENEDHIDIDPSPPPWRALRYVADEHDIDGLDDGGASARTAFRITHRIIRVVYDIPVAFDDSE